jgi:hypothetical protein
MSVEQKRTYDSEFKEMQCFCQRKLATPFLKWQKVQQVQLSFVLCQNNAAYSQSFFAHDSLPVLNFLRVYLPCPPIFQEILSEPVEIGFQHIEPVRNV